MTKHEIARLACRLMALYFMFQVTVDIGITVMWLVSAIVQGRWRFQGEFAGLIFSVAPPALLGGIALWLWTKADWMASRLLGDRSSNAGFEVHVAGAEPHIPIAFPSGRSEVTHLPLSVEDWTVVGFMIVGMFVLIDGIRAFVAIAYTAFTDIRTYQSMTHLDPTPVITAVVKTAIGLWLLLGSRTITGLILSARGKYAHPPIPETSDEGAA